MADTTNETLRSIERYLLEIKPRIDRATRRVGNSPLSSEYFERFNYQVVCADDLAATKQAAYSIAVAVQGLLDSIADVQEGMKGEPEEVDA